MAAKSGVNWKFFGFIVLIHVMLFAVLVQETWVGRAIGAERTDVVEVMGQDLAQFTRARADRWFTGAFVDTGVVRSSFDLYIPDAQAKANSTGMENAGAPIFAWFETRIRVFWALIYQATNRLSTALVWFPYGFFILVPFTFDGWIVRKVKQTNFDDVSPLRHSVGVGLVGLCLYAFVILLAVPFPVHPLWVPVFVLVVALAMQLVLSNTRKRI